MDEKISSKELITFEESDQLYRIVLIKDRDKKNNNIPAVSCFSLKKSDENCLSVDLEKLTTPEKTIARVGASYKTNTETFKDYSNREIYSLNIKFLRSIEKINDIIYDPIFNNPPIKGKPNNESHSLIQFNKIESCDEPEIFLKLRDHAKQNKIEVNFKIVEEIVKELIK